MKKLYRSKTNRVFAGVFGGLGAYFTIDPVLLRVIYVICAIFSGFLPGLIAYIAAALLIPEEGHVDAPHHEHADKQNN